MPADRRDLAKRLAARLGVRVSDEPLELTAGQAAAFTRGEVVSGWTGRAPRHPEYPDFSADATDGEIAEGLREEADADEAGTAPAFMPDAVQYAMQDAEYRRKRSVVVKQRMRDRVEGRPETPFPEVPRWAQEAEAAAHRELRRRHHERAHGLRAEAKAIEGRIAVDRHRSRIRPPRSRERTHAPRRRPRASSPRGDPPACTEGGEGEGDPPGRPPERLLPDLEDHLRRAGPLGIERDFLVEQVAAMGHALERVRAAISLLISMGIARAGIGDCDTPTIYPARGSR